VILVSGTNTVVKQLLQIVNTQIQVSYFSIFPRLIVYSNIIISRSVDNLKLGQKTLWVMAVCE